MLDCETSNIASSKTMTSLGGVLDRTEIDPYDGILTSVYYIDISTSLTKYKNAYTRFILEDVN